MRICRTDDMQWRASVIRGICTLRTFEKKKNIFDYIVEKNIILKLDLKLFDCTIYSINKVIDNAIKNNNYKIIKYNIRKYF